MSASKENPTQAQFRAYARIYDHFNRTLFGGKLKPVILNFSRAANSLGFFAPERWDNGSETTHEISLNPQYLKLRPARDVASTLVHEMAHCWQQEHGEPGRRGYHNKEWAAKMRELGLEPSSTGAPGGEAVGYAMSHYEIDGGAFARAFDAMPTDIKLPWLCFEGGAGGAGGKGGKGGKGGGAGKRGASKVKFSCPACGANAWGKPSLHLTCGDCNEEMVAEGATDDTEAERAAA